MSRHPALSAVLAAVAAVALAGCGSRPHSTVDEQPPPIASPSPLHPPLTPDRAYRSAVEAAIADGLHAPLHQLESRLRSQIRTAPGSTLMNLAKPLGFAQDQLGAIVLESLDHTADAAVRSGRWAPAGARKEKRYWTAQPAPSLIAEVSRWLVHG